MIIGCYEDLEIGKKYCDDNDKDGRIQLKEQDVKQPFIVIREATRDEWIECFKEMYEREPAFTPGPMAKYYLISTD